MVSDSCDGDFKPESNNYQCKEDYNKYINFVIYLQHSLPKATEEYVDIDTNIDIEWKSNQYVEFDDKNKRVHFNVNELTLISK